MRNTNGTEIYWQCTGIETYAFDQLLTEPRVFKLKTSVPTGNVNVTYADGTSEIIDCERLDARNAQVIKIASASTDILLTDFSLCK